MTHQEAQKLPGGQPYISVPSKGIISSFVKPELESILKQQKVQDNQFQLKITKMGQWMLGV